MSLTSLLAIASFHLILVSAAESDFLNATASTQADLIPWKWYIQPDIPNYVCPSPSSTLGTFAAVNVSVATINLVFGNRKVIHYFTGGKFGSPTAKDTWWFMFLLPLGLNLAANALIVYIYQNTPGYEEGFSIGKLTLFYTTRPRLGWIPLGMLMNYGRGTTQYTENKEARHEAIELQDTEPLCHVETKAQHTSDGPWEDSIQGYYEASAKGTLFAELFLLLVSTYYTGMTAHFAATKGYYIVGRLQGPHAHDARIMYSGALMSLISLFFAIAYLLVLLLDKENDAVLGSIIILASTSWLASWLFWAGYIRLAGNL